MKRVSLVVASLALALACGTAFAADAPAPVDKATIAAATAALAAYDIDKPRAPVWEVERLINATSDKPALRREIERGLVDALQKNTSDEGRYRICDLLWRIGTEASVPALARLLTDEKTAHYACIGLGRNASPAAAKALRDALAGAKGKALLAIINTLGDRRDGPSTPALAKLVTSDDPAAAEAAAGALGRIGSPEAAQVLAKALPAGGTKMRPAITQGYIQCAARLAEAGNDKAARVIYQELLVDRESSLARRAGLVGLMGLGGPEAASLAITTLGSTDTMMKAVAIANIRTLKGQGVSERFAAELSKLAPDLQALLIGALADRGDPVARPAVTFATKSANADVRLAAVRALGKMGDSSSVLVLAAATGSPEEKRSAQVSLRVLKGDGIDAAVIECMKSAAAGPKAELIQVLADRMAASAVPALLKEAASGDEAVRTAAFAAVGRLAGPKDLPAVVALLTGLQGDAGRQEAEGAVVAVARKVADENARADAALAALAGASPAAKASLLRVLKSLAGDKAFAAVQAALKDPDAGVRAAALRALADWPDARATPVVLTLFRTASTDTERVVALRGAVRLLGLAADRPAADTVKAYADLMQQARRPEEKKLVLAGLANVKDPAALAVVEPLAADPQVGAEAGLAAVGIARAIAGSYRDETKAAMTRLIAASKDPGVKEQAQVIIGQIERLGDFIAGWQIAGPYEEAGKAATALFDVAFDPEKPGAKAEWKLVSAAPGAGGAAIVDLAAAVGGEQRIAYARTWVFSDKDQPARLEMGVDDGVKAWLNGQVVYANNRGGACVPGSEKADVALKQGWNALVLKVSQITGPWAFCARLAKRDGARLEGVRYDPRHE